MKVIIPNKIKTGVIYKLRNNVTGKIYIGQTVDFEKRMRTHNLAKENTCIHRSIRKHGFSSFEIEILYESKEYTDDILNELEMKYIVEFSSKAPLGYNMTDGGGGTRGMKGHIPSEEEKERARRTKLERKHLYAKRQVSEEHRLISKNKNSGSGNPFYGKNHSEETRKKMSLLKKGKSNHWLGKKRPKYSKERILEYRKRFSGKNNPRYGAVLTEETKKKIRDSLSVIRKCKQCDYMCNGMQMPSHVRWSHPKE